jgi:CheY-like chemotaxis protein
MNVAGITWSGDRRQKPQRGGERPWTTVTVFRAGEREQGGEMDSSDASFAPPFPVRVFLVEDNPQHSFIAVTVLNQLLGEATEVILAENGEEALSLITRFTDHDRPDLILIDLRLPDNGGFDVLAAVRSHEACVQVPALVLTSSLYDKDVAQSYELGASAVLCKPLSRANLREELTRIGKLAPKESSFRATTSH